MPPPGHGRASCGLQASSPLAVRSHQRLAWFPPRSPDRRPASDPCRSPTASTEPTLSSETASQSSQLSSVRNQYGVHFPIQAVTVTPADQRRAVPYAGRRQKVASSMSEAPYGNPLAQVVLRAADAFDRGCDRDDLRSAHTRMYLWRMGARDVFRSRSRVPTEVPCLLLSVGDVYGFRPAPSGRYKAEATKYYSYLCAAAEFCGVDPEMQISELSGDVSRACRSAAMEAASLAGPRQDADWSVSADWIRSVDAAASRVRHRLLSKLSASPSEASCAADDLRAECDAAIRAARVDPRAPTMKQETIILGKMGYRLLSGTGARRFPPGAMPPFQTDIRGRDLLPHEAALGPLC